MLRPIETFTLAFALAASLTTLAAHAQQYPNRPVKVVVGFAPGSGPDVMGRTLAAQLGNDLGQSFFVENRTGANGTIGIGAVVQSPPDGHTLLFSSSSITPVPFVSKNVSFDIRKDLRPIATAGILDGVLMLVHPSTPVHNVQEFIEYAKKNRVLYGSPGVGNILHLNTELFRQRAGLTMEHIPYKGASEVQTALLGQQIHVMFVTPPSVLSVVKEGKLRAIGYTGSKPFPELPEVPLVRDALAGFALSPSWSMLYAPAKTPDAIVERLNAAVQHALTTPVVSGVIKRNGYVPDGRSAAQTAEFFLKEVAAAGVAVKAAGIAPE
jgi:tripartite-type tricarboxylate transporter receptor subunit TctC